MDDDGTRWLVALRRGLVERGEHDRESRTPASSSTMETGSF